MIRCPSGWIGWVALGAVLAFICAGCPRPDPTAARVRAAINGLGSPDFERSSQAHHELIAIGGPAVPELVRALGRADDRTVIEVILTLGDLKDRRAVSELVRLADRHPDVRATPEVWLGDDSRNQALCAQEVIANICDPSTRTWEGHGIAVFPITDETLEPITAYHDRIAEWYKSWRRQYDPRTWEK